MQQWTETAIAAALDGKFFTLNGRDIMGEAREREDRNAMLARRVKQPQRPVPLRVLNKSSPFTADSIILAVSKAHNISVADILSKARFRHIIDARHHCAALMRKFTGLTTVQIAAAINVADHSTVLHAVKAWARRGARYFEQDIKARQLLGVLG